VYELVIRFEIDPNQDDRARDATAREAKRKALDTLKNSAGIDRADAELIKRTTMLSVV
jgi:hypothetical protein